MTKKSNHFALRKWGLGLLMTLLLGALVACSQPISVDIPTASEGQDAAASAAANGTQPEAASAEPDREDTALAWARCIRENGVSEFPDPDAEGRILLPRGRIDPESTVFQQATDACRHLAPEGWGDTETDPADVEVMLEFAQCMRENGVPDYPDPDPNNGNRITLEPNNPKSHAALDACKAILDNLQGGARIGG
jgi:hypothetical protein